VSSEPNQGLPDNHVIQRFPVWETIFVEVPIGSSNRVIRLKEFSSRSGLKVNVK
jgi:hypothetical protein